ncbi:hypothetical protein G6F57_011476 [Rhizopus arrhizus]|uniref:Uncharacterized protein n=1 Tax=Rhizopus oryzae TaxID=64495 RepID=A0A9P7BRN5_RHIOR|nr:hypothetical protein G6F30_008452 [Rhizopus arrhizus]KAG1419962.1 hypothetical protein G6F58_004382 [Rhizopus delemar]KAG0979292.1 hypothetical protein G6F29_008694 [Rhizopus arrhizus]KAG0992076.1 hypothetical protein G6F28_007985 [Rhizopus arrhizus]KAG1007743.1 hypothetical protein G6F27_007125 [Rhizopus arrhizus]
MRLLVLLKEYGKRYMYNENGAEAMGIVDEKSNPFALKQIVNLDSYLEEKAKFLANDKHVGQSEEGIGTTMKISTERLTKYIEHGSDTKEPFFQPKSQLQEEYKQYLIEFYKYDTGAYIQDDVKIPTSKFAGLEIKKSRVREFMRDNCDLSFKKAAFWSEARESSDTT